MVGLSADDEFIEDLVKLAQNHDDRIVSVDRTIAYFFGCKYNVEMDIILPNDFTLEEGHDVGVSLQNELEEVDEVARAVVHVRSDDEYNPMCGARASIVIHSML